MYSEVLKALRPMIILKASLARSEHYNLNKEFSNTNISDKYILKFHKILLVSYSKRLMFYEQTHTETHIPTHVIP